MKASLYIHANSFARPHALLSLLGADFLFTMLAFGCLTCPWAGFVRLVPFLKKKQLLAVKPFIHSKHREMLLYRPTSERQRSLTTAGSVCKVNSLILEEISSSEIVSMRRS